MSAGLSNIAGVRKVRMIYERKLAELDFDRDNKVTLEALRDAIRAVGFQPKAIELTAIAIAETASVRLTGAEASYPVLETSTALLRAALRGPARIQARARLDGDKGVKIALDVKSMKPENER